MEVYSEFLFLTFPLLHDISAFQSINLSINQSLRTTRFLTEEGFYKFHNWFDDRAWYPLGRIIGGTIYPGLMVTSATVYHILHFLHVTIDIRNVCVFLAPLFSSFTTLITYEFTKELSNSGAGEINRAEYVARCSWSRALMQTT